MRRRKNRSGAISSAVVACGVAVAIVAGNGELRAESVPLEEFSPAFLGMYRKVLEIEDQIRGHTERYGVDFDLARAVCLYESGGNPGLVSHAGAQGYFQVMPATFRELNVATNIEAGVKYLALMIQQFGREDRAVAAYNGGPGRVGRAGGLPLETLQYVIGVGHYRTLLKQHDAALRRHASPLRLATVGAADDWEALSRRLGIAEWELRLHNAFLAGRRLRPGERVAYPPEPRADLLMPVDGGATYRMRLGDNYIKLAIMLGLEVEALRAENGLWQTQTLPAGVVLRIPFSIDRSGVIKTALADRELRLLAAAPPVRTSPAVAPAARASAAAPAPTPIVHRVVRGDTLTRLARRYGTSVSAIQQANGLQRPTIQAGQLLRIPPADSTKRPAPVT